MVQNVHLSLKVIRSKFFLIAVIYRTLHKTRRLRSVASCC